MSSAYDIDTGDDTLFGPFMQFVLEPGEYGCVMGVSDTSNAGSGHVFTNRADGSVAVVDTIDESPGGFGRERADACADEYGFRPFTEPEASLERIAHGLGDPIVKYRSIAGLEPMIADGEPNIETASLRCPDCGEREDIACTRVRWRRVYEGMYRCGSCGESFIGSHCHLRPSPTDSCPWCGSRFVERDLQYPEIGSTAFECANCGFVTFDTLGLDDEVLAPAAERPELVGPDIGAYRETHSLESSASEPAEPSEPATSGSAPSETDESGFLSALERLLGR